MPELNESATFSMGGIINLDENLLRQQALKSFVAKQQKEKLTSNFDSKIENLLTSCKDKSALLTQGNSNGYKGLNFNAVEYKELELRKKALLSFSSRKNNLTRVSSLPVLQTKTTIKNSLKKQQFIVTLNAFSDNSSDDESFVKNTSISSVQPTVTLGCHVSHTSTTSTSQKPSVDSSTLHSYKANSTSTLPSYGYTNNKEASNVPINRTVLLKGCNAFSVSSARKPIAEPSLSAYKKLITKHSARIKQLKAFLTKQHEILNERKKTETSLTITVSALKNKLRRSIQLQNRARLATIKATKQKSMAASDVETAEKQLIRLNSVVERMARKAALSSRQAGANLVTVPHKDQLSSIRLMLIHYLNLLLSQIHKCTHLSSPLVKYFHLPIQNCQLVNCDQFLASSHDRSPVKLTSCLVDPFVPICPFFLDGDCLDVSCTFQHPGPDRKSTDVARINSHHTALSSNLYKLDQQKFTICPVCNESLDFVLDSTKNFCENVNDWHSNYLHCTFSHRDWSSIPSLDSSSVLIKSCDVNLLKHQLYALLTSNKHSHVNMTVKQVFDFLVKVSFPPSLFEFAITYPTLSLVARRKLVCTSLAYLLSQAHCMADSFEFSVKLINPITTVVYFASKIEWDVCGSHIGLQLIDNLLNWKKITCKQLPFEHPARWGIWYLRIILELSSSFPEYYFFKSPGHVPYFEPEQLLQLNNLFREIDDDLDLPKNLQIFLNKCHKYNTAFSDYYCLLSFVHIYIQFISATGQNEQATAYCVSLLKCNSQLIAFDNIFFPSAIHFSNLCLQTGATKSFELVTDLTTEFVSTQTEFAFLFACLMHRADKPDSCSSLLSELISRFILLPSLEISSLYSAFRVLLGLSEPVSVLLFEDDILATRNYVYLWMCFGLFCIVHSIGSSILPDFIASLAVQLHSSSMLTKNVVYPFPFAAMLLHLGLRLADELTSPLEYSETVQSLLFQNEFTNNESFRQSPPPWFLELIHLINFKKFDKEHLPNTLCVRLVETFGFQALKALLDNLLNYCNAALLQSLVSIARLERPIDEFFWLLVISSGSKFYSKTSTNFRQLQTYLIECFTEALELVPYSCTIWRYYALTIRDGFVSMKHDGSLSSPNLNLFEQVKQHAEKFGMSEIVKEIFNQPLETPVPTSCMHAMAFKTTDVWWKESLLSDVSVDCVDPN